MPSSTLHQLTGGLKYLRDTLFIFKTFHLREELYVTSPFQFFFWMLDILERFYI